jgi:hypothetical protein
VGAGGEHMSVRGLLFLFLFLIQLETRFHAARSRQRARQRRSRSQVSVHNKDAQRRPAFRFRVPTNPRLWVHALQTAHQRA